MRQLFTIIFLLIIGQGAFATEWFTYFIYVQKEYIQGPWIRAGILDKSGSYLEPKQFDELFSISGDGLDIANAILSHLKEETPERYKFEYTLTISRDTIVIKITDTIRDFDAVKNELTASYILNNFGAVKIIQQNRAGIYLLKNVTVPYMDLVLPAQTTAQTQINSGPDNTRNDTSTSARKNQSLPIEKSKASVSIWLMISLAINLLLFILLVRQRK